MRSPNELWRENQQPVITVTAELENRDLGSVNRDLQTKLSELKFPPGYRWELAGSYRAQQESFASLLTVLIVAAALVFLLLGFQFKSLTLPILIFLAQPVSLASALFALWITGTPLNVSSFMGAILLIGLDVKNGIILIEYIGQLREEGMPLREALVQAGRTRFRPILMTSLCTILGLVPLAMGLGPGAQMQQPLAIAVIGGLITNMLLTRLLIPVGYLVLKGRRGPDPRAFRSNKELGCTRTRLSSCSKGENPAYPNGTGRFQRARPTSTSAGSSSAGSSSRGATCTNRGIAAACAGRRRQPGQRAMYRRDTPSERCRGTTPARSPC